MRVSPIAKYTDVLDFEVEEKEVPHSASWENITTMRWKLPNITDEQEAAIRDEIDAKFGPTDSSLEKKKVLEWRIHKRKSKEWCIYLEFEKKEKDCTVSFGFKDTRYDFRTGSVIIQKGADVEFLFQFGNSWISFNDAKQIQVTHPKCINGSERFAQYNELVTVETFNQLKNVPKDQLSVTVLEMFEDYNPGMNLRSNFDWFTLPTPIWKSSDQTGTDVEIWTGDGHIYCHSNLFTRNSRVLSELLVSPTLKPFEVHLRDMSKIQLEAFLTYQYYGVTDKILEAPMTSLEVLKAAERYETWEMWTDTMKGLLDKDSEWFEGAVAPEFAYFLSECSKREEVATKLLIQKISKGLQRLSQPVEEKSRNEESDKAGENMEVQENREAGDNEAESGCHDSITMNEIRSNELAQMLESKWIPVALLKVAQTHKSDGIWNDIILTLLEKDSVWFEWDLALELKSFLDICFKRDEEATRKLTKTLSQLLEQPKPIGLAEATQVREQEGPNGGIVENTRNSQPERAKRRRVTEEDPDQLTGNMNSRAQNLSGPATVDQNLRRSARLLLKAGKRKKGGLQTEEPQKKRLRLTTKSKKTTSKRKPGRVAKTTKRKPVQKRKRGLQSEDLSWKRALEHAAENARNASKSGGAGRGPRDIWKDPVLPKVSIFPDIPDPEVKVEKVEPPEEENENSAGIDAVAVEIQQMSRTRFV